MQSRIWATEEVTTPEMEVLGLKRKAFLATLALSILILTAVAGKSNVMFRPTVGPVDVPVDSQLSTQYVYQVDPALPLATDGVPTKQQIDNALWE